MEYPHDIIRYIFTFLNDKEVMYSSSTCSHWRMALSDQLWKRRIIRPDDHDSSRLISSQLSTTQWMRLCLEMNGVFKMATNVIAKDEEASSTDFNQTLFSTLTQNQLYWSSRASFEEESNEYIIYKLNHPFCVISTIRIMPFLASWQRGSPIYAPKAVQISIGFHKDNMHFTSKIYPCQNSNTLQSFELDEPQFGGYVRIDLLGRQQRQPGNDAFYTVLQYVSAIGTNLNEIQGTKPVLYEALKKYGYDKFGKERFDTLLSLEVFLFNLFPTQK